MIQPQRLLDTFLSYVRIDSESTREGAMARRLADDLSAIGCQVYVDGSAAQALCHAVAHMKLLRIDEDTTANVGTISALGPTNIVSPRAELLAEARSRDTAKLQAQAQHMMDCLEQACQTFGATLEGGILPACTAYALPDDHPLVLEVASACRRVGLEPVLAASGGISDANSFNTHGIAALVLGTGMSKVHTTQEEITVKNLEDTAALVLALITG